MKPYIFIFIFVSILSLASLINFATINDNDIYSLDEPKMQNEIKQEIKFEAVEQKVEQPEPIYFKHYYIVSDIDINEGRYEEQRQKMFNFDYQGNRIFEIKADAYSYIERNNLEIMGSYYELYQEQKYDVVSISTVSKTSYSEDNNYIQPQEENNDYQRTSQLLYQPIQQINQPRIEQSVIKKEEQKISINIIQQIIQNFDNQYNLPKNTFIELDYGYYDASRPIQTFTISKNSEITVIEQKPTSPDMYFHINQAGIDILQNFDKNQFCQQMSKTWWIDSDATYLTQMKYIKLVNIC